MRNSRRIVTHQVGRNADRARFAEPPPRNGSKADGLPTSHPDFTPIDALHMAGGTKAERSVAAKCNAGSHWERIAQDTGYALLTVRRLH